jgi:hypothetical protein
VEEPDKPADVETTFVEHVTLYVEPDGRGRLTLDRLVGGTLLPPVLQDLLATDGDAHLALSSFAAAALARWRGAIAWSDVDARCEGRASVRLRATAWFDELGALGEETGELCVRFELSREADALVVRRVEDRGPRLRAAASAVLSGRGPSLEERYAAVERATRELRHTWTFVLPARAPGAPRPESEVRLDTADQLERCRSADAVARALHRDVEDGACSVDDAIDQLTALLAAMGVIEARCASPTEEDPAGRDHFSSRLDAARATWSGSSLSTLVEALKARRRLLAGGGAAAGALSALAVAQERHRERAGSFAPTLRALGGARLVDPELARGARDGYAFTLHRSPVQPAWIATACPCLPGAPGPSLVVNHAGVVHAYDGRAFSPDDVCGLPDGATPIS